MNDSLASLDAVDWVDVDGASCPTCDGDSVGECDVCFDARWNVTPDPMGYDAIRSLHPDLFVPTPHPTTLAA